MSIDNTNIQEPEAEPFEYVPDDPRDGESSPDDGELDLHETLSLSDQLGIPRGAMVVMGVLAVFIIMTVVTAIMVPRILNARRESIEKNVRATLQSIGASQVAYRNSNVDSKYGTFGNLKDDNYIADSYTMSDIIDDYSIFWGVSHTPAPVSSVLPSAGISTSRFTVIAYPYDTRPGYLRTYSLTEDNLIRVYNPDSGDDRYDVKTWDPVL